MLFESLAHQTSTDFELICIDDTGPMNKETGERGPPVRRVAAVAYARRRGVPLVALVPSKKKTRGLRFGQCNAINSGLVLASGKFITVVQDNVWLLPNFVERTVSFFATHDRDVILSYPERRVAPPPGRLKREWMNDTSVLIRVVCACMHARMHVIVFVHACIRICICVQYMKLRIPRPIYRCCIYSTPQ